MSEDAAAAGPQGSARPGGEVRLLICERGLKEAFFDAILPNGTAVLPAFGPKPISAGAAATTLKKLGFLS